MPEQSDVEEREKVLQAGLLLLFLTAKNLINTSSSSRQFGKVENSESPSFSFS
jgi:hypothetical protein